MRRVEPRYYVERDASKPTPSGNVLFRYATVRDRQNPGRALGRYSDFRDGESYRALADLQSAGLNMISRLRAKSSPGAVR